VINPLRQWWWRRTYRPGRTLSRFIACDIRRDIEVIDASRLSDGILIVKTRTLNVLYAAALNQGNLEFGPPREIALSQLWYWPGETWGGPVPPHIDEGPSD
jgi:hypothetical protein